MQYLMNQGVTGRNGGRAAACPRGWNIPSTHRGLTLPINTVP